jgi:stage II sporulation protein D
LANLDTHSARSYDVSSDVFSQVYGGQTSESTATNKAVDDTCGQVLVDRQGVPVEAFFHSSCGGQTENPRYVWKGINDPPAYLAGVKDAYCQDDPYLNWHVQLNASLIRRRLRRVGVWLGDIQKINLAKISPSGRAWAIEVISNKGKALIPGNRFRMAVGPEVLRSTLVTKVQKVGRAFRFEGHGWGHGVGFCQWGARGRALAGQSYKEILQAYYPQTRLVDARK